MAGVKVQAYIREPPAAPKHSVSSRRTPESITTVLHGAKAACSIMPHTTAAESGSRVGAAPLRGVAACRDDDSREGRHCERSNPESRDDAGLLRRCAPRNDGGETCVLILAPAFASECCSSDRPLENEGAGKAGCRSHPWPACSRKSRRQSPQVRAGSSGLPRAMVGTAYTCSPRGPAFCPRRPRARRTWQRELGLSTGRPEPHDFAVRIGSFVGMIAHAATRHAHRIPHPTLVTIAMRPSSEAGWRDHSIDFRKTEGV